MYLTRFFLTFSLFILSASAAKSQHKNLVLNGSFEDTLRCPYFNSLEKDGLFTAKNWISIGTCDHYHTCNDSIKRRNPSLELQNIACGDSYAGFIPLSISGVTEAFIGELDHPLKKNKKYFISFFLRTSKISPYFTNTLGFRFLKETSTYLDTGKEAVLSYQMGGSQVYPPIISNKIKPDFYIDSSNFLKNFSWVQITDTVKARGGEKFFRFGSFYLNPNQKKSLFRPSPKKIFNKSLTEYINRYLLHENPNHQEPKDDFDFKRKNKVSYYFVDNFVVKPINY